MTSQEQLIKELQIIGLTTSQLMKVIDALIRHEERSRQELCDQLAEASQTAGDGRNGGK